MPLCIYLPNFVQIGPSARQSYDVIFIYWLLQTTREVQMGLWAGSSNFDSIGIIVSGIFFVLRGFELKLPIYVVVSSADAQNDGFVYLRGKHWPHILICGVDLPTLPTYAIMVPYFWCSRQLQKTLSGQVLTEPNSVECLESCPQCHFLWT